MESAQGAGTVLASDNAFGGRATHPGMKDPARRGRSPGGRLLRRTWRLSKDQRGASALELALVLPFLLLILTGMIDAGMLLFTQHNMFRVAQNAARNLALGSMNEVQVVCYAEDKLSNLGANLNVVATLPVAPATDISVTITVPVADVVPIDVIGATNTLFQAGTLQSRVTMRQEVAPPAGVCT